MLLCGVLVLLGIVIIRELAPSDAAAASRMLLCRQRREGHHLHQLGWGDDDGLSPVN